MRRGATTPADPAVAVNLERQRSLLDWYVQHQRVLPWRHPGPGPHPHPYHVLLSELMLQQTRVETVVGPYLRWLERVPTLPALAAAEEDSVVAAWAGLGYYRRARHLLGAARAVVAEHGGVLPREEAALLALPGIGRYSAGAVRSIGHGLPAPLVDGNVARVLARWHAVDVEVDSPAGAALLWRHASAELGAVGPARGDPSRWNQALMELGASLCAPKRPACAGCPVRASCRAEALGVAETLPRKAPRRPPSAVQAEALVVLARDAEGHDEVWLLQRPSRGRWAGLWQPPMAEGEARLEPGLAPLRALLLRLGARIAPVGSLEHVLTHRHYAVTVEAAQLGAAALALAQGELREAALALGFVDVGLRDAATLSGDGDGVSRLGVRLLALALQSSSAP